MTLRVLPRLALAVTEDSVRRRKRLVMLLPGLVAFALYRLVKHVDPLSDPWTLLVLSGLVSAATAAAAYRLGRSAPWAAIWSEDRARRLTWLVGWIGFAYGVQLSLMVLALLKIVIQYDFLLHPDGPAMMAIIIAATSVSRDAFEIGHVRRLQRAGESVLTFPDGATFRAWLSEQPVGALRWGIVAAVCSGLVAVSARFGEAGRSDLGQLLVVTLAAGCLAVVAYLAGEQRPEGWRRLLSSAGWPELFRFWWWPGLAFGATYYLVLAGAVVFLLRLGAGGVVVHGIIAAAVGGLMALYCYYLGCRRFVENRIQQTVPDSLLRCPFVLGMLSKSSGRSSVGARPVPANEVVLGEAGRRS